MDRKAVVACLAAGSIAAGVVVSTVVANQSNSRNQTQAPQATVTVTTTVPAVPSTTASTPAEASPDVSESPTTVTQTVPPSDQPTTTTQPGEAKQPAKPDQPTKQPTEESKPDSPNPVDENAKSPSTFNYVLPRGGSYGRTHHHYPASDIFAPCGAKFLSPVDGVVSAVSAKDVWTRKTNRGPERGGLSIAIDAGAVRYYGSHEAKVFVKVGDRVRRGQIIGTVGETGSAKGTGCHIHFGLSPTACLVESWWIRRGTIYPWPFLDAWKRGDVNSSKADPTQEVLKWHQRNGCPSKPGTYK